MKLILLGTGIPMPNPNRCGPSQVVLVDGATILIDCGSGTTTQLIRAGIDPTAVDHLFFTHHHFDHNVDYAHFVLAGWAMKRGRPLAVYGPKGTVKFTKVLFEDAFEIDIKTRLSGGRYQVSDGLEIESQDIDEGFSLDKGNWRLTAARVNHMARLGNYALAYRIDSKDSSLVISGDTAMCEGLVRFAKGADILVHEVFYSPELVATGSVTRCYRKAPNNDPADYAGVRMHTPPEQVGKVAKGAEIKTLVLTHFFSDTNLEEMVEIVKKDFDGQVILGKDLMEMDI